MIQHRGIKDSVIYKVVKYSVSSFKKPLNIKISLQKCFDSMKLHGNYFLARIKV